MTMSTSFAASAMGSLSHASSPAVSGFVTAGSAAAASFTPATLPCCARGGRLSSSARALIFSVGPAPSRACASSAFDASYVAQLEAAILRRLSVFVGAKASPFIQCASISKGRFDRFRISSLRKGWGSGSALNGTLDGSPRLRPGHRGRPAAAGAGAARVSVAGDGASESGPEQVQSLICAHAHNNK